MNEEMKYELMKLGVEIEKAGTRFAGKYDRLKKYLLIHFEQDFYGKLLEALENDDIEAAERYSHSLKGDFKNFEFGELTASMEKINEILKTGSKEGVLQLVEDIDTPYKKICETVQL